MEKIVNPTFKNFWWGIHVNSSSYLQKMVSPKISEEISKKIPHAESTDIPQQSGE